LKIREQQGQYMQNIIALCRCVGAVPKKRVIEFHFRGVYSGHKIRKILVRYYGMEEINLDEDYLIYIGEVKVKESILTGVIWRVKSLNNVYA